MLVMDQKEENEKKRKADPSPRLNSATKATTRKLINKAKKIRKTKQKFVFTDESEEEDRSRTPSGTELSGKVQGIRSFFSPINKSVIRPNPSSQHIELKTVDLKSLGCTMPLNASPSTEHGLHASLDMSSDKNNNNNRCESADQVIMNIHDEEQDKSLGCEKAFLLSLSDQLVNKMDMGIKEIAQSHILSANNLQKEQENMYLSSDQQVSTNNTSENAATNLDMVSPIETNTEENPTTMSVSSVVEMLRSFKKDISEEIKKEKNELKDAFKLEIRNLQVQCVKEATKEAQNFIKNDPKIRKMEEEVAFWKLKAEILTEVCDRMNTEISDLSTRMDTH